MVLTIEGYPGWPMEGSLSRASQIRPGGHELRREVVVHHQRERILAAAVELIAERGYRAVTVADIVKRAATGRLKFYENFSSKQDCFFAAYDRALEEALRRVGEASKGGATFPERLSAALAALLAYMAEQPELARACVLEAPSLGAAMQERNERALAGFAGLLRRTRGQAETEELPAGVEESVLGGLYWLIYNAILSGKPKRIEDLHPELVEFALLPFPDANRHAEPLR
jgi:AcrR family transcriptional regulator